MAGRGRGGRGGGRGGRGGFGSSGNPIPMGLTFADIQNMSREGTALYPPMRPPVLSEYSDKEKRIAASQIGFATRMKRSAYYIVEQEKSTELPRYSDKYRPSSASQPKLQRTDLHAPFFPPEIFDAHFNPKKKPKTRPANVQKKSINLDDMMDEDEQEKSDGEQSDAESQVASDYDAEEEYDNDYAENYFDNGEGDDMDDLGGGGGGDAGDYD
ncbi:hypothetical protein VKT23_007502 [Stygiomarasmius scandens]|uniref:DNA-directed RNA polymerase III subunit n=1 Tax=Marasmiellus scandens TaxID=2682957 RepID=A0ABR1JKN9_9AGAR